jgi:hypothetical protein
MTRLSDRQCLLEQSLPQAARWNLSRLRAFAMPLADHRGVSTTRRLLAAKPTDVLTPTLIGLKISNEATETIGAIKDLTLSQGELAGDIVSVGGCLGMGERQVVVRGRRQGQLCEERQEGDLR